MKTTQKPLRTLARLFRYFKYHRALFFLGLFLVILASLSGVLVNGMLSPVVDAVATQKDMGLFVRALSIMLAFMLLSVISNYLGQRFMAVLSQSTMYEIRRELSEKLVRLPVSYYDSTPHGETMSTFTNDIDILTQALEQGIFQIILATITFFGAIAMMFYLNWQMTLLVLVFIGIMLLTIKFIAGFSSRYYIGRQQATAKLNGYVEEMVSAQKVVRVFNYEDPSQKAFNERTEELKHLQTRAATFGVIVMPVAGNISLVLYAVVAIVGGLQVIAGKMTLGNITAFLQFTRNISNPVIQVSTQLNALFAAIAGAERIFALLDEEEEAMRGEVRLEDGMWHVPNEDGSYDLVPLKGDVRFYDVDFGYVEGTTVLSDISLYAKPGQKIALVGSTGAGKTTITNLINRFYDINAGTITLDGIALQRIDKYDLRSIMSVVLQDVNLFSGTIAENIRYGKLDATDVEVIKAAMSANAHHFISKLEDGYETHITGSAMNLSQGERQLLSIARAAIADPVILIMDEATSSVDTRTEKLIAKGMDALMKNRTTFVIAHRLSTVRDADAIMVLEQGKIIERGNHDELMALKGRYYELTVSNTPLD